MPATKHTPYFEGIPHDMRLGHISCSSGRAVAMAAGRAILATRVDRGASGALTRCDDALVYGAATFRDFLVDALQASGVSRAAAQSQVRMALKQAPRLLSVALCLFVCAKAPSQVSFPSNVGSASETYRQSLIESLMALIIFAQLPLHPDFTPVEFSALSSA